MGGKVNDTSFTGSAVFSVFSVEAWKWSRFGVSDFPSLASRRGSSTDRISEREYHCASMKLTSTFNRAQAHISTYLRVRYQDPCEEGAKHQPLHRSQASSSLDKASWKFSSGIVYGTESSYPGLTRMVLDIPDSDTDLLPYLSHDCILKGFSRFNEPC